MDFDLIPIWYGILGLAVAMLFHEFAHGILTRVADTKVKSLGLLYLKYGLFEQALEQFDRIVSDERYLPAIMNKANVHSILGDLTEALLLARGAFYQQTGGNWVFVVDESGSSAVSDAALARQSMAPSTRP